MIEIDPNLSFALTVVSILALVWLLKQVFTQETPKKPSALPVVYILMPSRPVPKEEEKPKEAKLVWPEKMTTLDKIAYASKEGWVVFLFFFSLASLGLTLSLYPISSEGMAGWVANPNAILAYICAVIPALMWLISLGYAVLNFDMEGM